MTETLSAMKRATRADGSITSIKLGPVPHAPVDGPVEPKTTMWEKGPQIYDSWKRGIRGERVGTREDRQGDPGDQRVARGMGRGGAVQLVPNASLEAH